MNLRDKVKVDGPYTAAGRLRDNAIVYVDLKGMEGTLVAMDGDIATVAFAMNVKDDSTEIPHGGVPRIVTVILPEYVLSEIKNETVVEDEANPPKEL